MRAFLTIAGAGLMAGPVAAANLTVDVELPRMSVAEYHKPYVAVWIAETNHRVAANLAVWYQQYDGAEGKGEQWLKDVRQWWRRSGRQLELPVDGVSTPTRAPGAHSLTFEADAAPLSGLPAGDYILCVEAAREVGGRELVRIPFTWGGNAAQEQTAQGETELGEITLKIVPSK